MINTSEPLILRCKIEWVRGGLFFLSGSLFTAVGVYMIVKNEPAGWFIAGFFGLIPCICLLRLLPSCAFLKVSHDGVELCECFRSVAFPWAEIESFEYINFPPKDAVEMVITDSDADERDRILLPQVCNAMPLTLANLLSDWQSSERPQT